MLDAKENELIQREDNNECAEKTLNIENTEEIKEPENKEETGVVKKKRGRKKKEPILDADGNPVEIKTSAKPKRKQSTRKSKVESKRVVYRRRTIEEIKTISPVREDVVCKALLGSFEYKKTKDDKDFYDITLLDMTGGINAKLWSKEIKDNFNEQLLSSLMLVSPENPIVVAVVGQKDMYGDTPQLKVMKMKILESENYLDLVPVTKMDAIDMYKFVRSYADNLRHPYNLVANEFFNEYGRAFFDAPAAKFYHDNFRCGLLEHTFKMLKMVSYVTTIFPLVDADILAFMIMMHDFEKINGYYLVPKPELTLQEIMVGHATMGATKLHNCLRKYNLPDKIIFALMNSIIAHHGEAEYGSAKPAYTLEAQALVYIDNMVSALAGAEQNIAEKDYVEGKINDNLYYIDYSDMESKIY